MPTGLGKQYWTFLGYFGICFLGPTPSRCYQHQHQPSNFLWRLGNAILGFTFSSSFLPCVGHQLPLPLPPPAVACTTVYGDAAFFLLSNTLWFIYHSSPPCDVTSHKYRVLDAAEVISLRFSFLWYVLYVCLQRSSYTLLHLALRGSHSM